MRDLALADADFARLVLPVLEEFLGSRGAGERAACLVAVARIRHAQRAGFGVGRAFQPDPTRPDRASGPQARPADPPG